VHVLSTSVSGLEMAVDECPSCARGACPFLCPWSALCFCLLHMYKNLYYCKDNLFSSEPVGTEHENRDLQHL